MSRDKHIEGIDPKIAVEWHTPYEENPIRNTVHQYIKFKDSSVFSPAAAFFRKHKRYTFFMEGTLDYENFWDEEEKRCINGYTVGGVRVTGRHYFYLNYCMIKLMPTCPKTGHILSKNKVKDFPRFLDHNYYFFLELEKNLAEGPWKSVPKYGQITVKGRRKGHTYLISGGVYAYNYTFIPDSNSILAAGEKDHYKVTLGAFKDALSNLGSNTVWGKKRLVNQHEHFKSGWIEMDNGVPVEKGFNSEVRALSFADNAFKSIGESVTIFGCEESGKFSNLSKALGIAEGTYREGEFMIGIPIVWGTGGDMGKGTKDLAEMFYDTEQFLFQGYDNIYDNNAVGKCGYFIDSMWFYPCMTTKEYTVNGEVLPIGSLGVDAQGNSIRRVAYAVLMEERERRRNNKTSYNTYITQYPLTPAEAFLKTSGTIFDTINAQIRLSEIESSREKFRNKTDIGTVEFTKFSVPYFKPNRDLVPLYEFPLKDCIGKPGAIIIYQHPVLGSDGLVMKNRYIAGIDSYDKDISQTNSVGSIVIFDRLLDRIVAQYKGRPLAADFYETCRRLLLYYSAKANYEKANLGIYSYFDKLGSIELLCDQPEILKEKGISKVSLLGTGRKGTAPVAEVIAFGLKEYKAWSESRIAGQKEGGEISNISVIESESILKETIAWNETGNFDDISSLVMLFIYRADLMKMKLVENKVSVSQYDCDFFKRKMI